MTDFMVRMVTDYPWFGWLTAVLAVAGLAYVAVWVAGLSAYASDWIAYRRAVLGWKTAVRRVGDDGDRLCPMHALEAEKATGTDHLLEDDPPEYQHDDGPDPGYDWDGPGDDWSPMLAWGPSPVMPAREMADLATVLERAHELGLLDDDQLPDGPPAEWMGNRCTNRDCYRYGQDHPGACDQPPTMPAACYPAMGLADGPAMPPQDWSGYAASLEVLARGDGDKPLHPAIQASLEAAGFAVHDTTEGLVDTSYTRAMAREVEAMVTDGVIAPE